MSEQTPAGRLFSRRRRANVEGGRQHFHKVKVSPEEEAQLLQLAEQQGVTIPRLLVESALSLDAPETPTERKQAIAELFAVNRLLANIANNVNQLARHANSGDEFPADAAAALARVKSVAMRIEDTVERINR
ncbi:plasmid mobilization relaxosome protein MobC [Paeniglutamicibacter gangotriensis]|uniref:plasmid mobilization relaxosome protein MobC n=1 Tax=Paeniglutamicibacter gangotriensis TaxID=254787 RepID=UPI00374462DF